MAEPKYYVDDKAILDMMYQMVYGGQPTTSIERSYGGMKEPPKTPDDSIIDEYMELNKGRDKARAEASISAIKTGADLLSVPYGIAKQSVMKAVAPSVASMTVYPKMRTQVDDEPILSLTPKEKQRYEQLTPEEQKESREIEYFRSAIPLSGTVPHMFLQSADASMLDEKMKELYKQMTPEQQDKVKAKLREQSMEKMDSAIDSYSGDF